MSSAVANLAVGRCGGVVVWVGASLTPLFGVWDLGCSASNGEMGLALGFGFLRRQNGFGRWDVEVCFCGLIFGMLGC
jgi:hypothetical protein